MHKIQRKIRRHKQLPRVRSQSIARPDVKDASMAMLPAEPRKLRVWSRISDQAKINIFINVFSIFKIRCFTIALALHFQYDVLQLMSSTLSFTQIIIQVNNDGEVPGRLFAHDDQYYHIARTLPLQGLKILSYEYIFYFSLKTSLPNSTKTSSICHIAIDR